jgi:hypothetical protein
MLRRNHVSPRCIALLSLLSPLLIPRCGPPLPLLLSAAALVLHHSEKLPPSSLCRWALWSRNLPQTVEPPCLEHPSSCATHCHGPPWRQLSPVPLQNSRHLLAQRADASWLANPAINAGNRSTNLALASTSARDVPPWEACASESPTTPLPQIECPPYWLPPRPTAPTSYAALRWESSRRPCPWRNGQAPPCPPRGPQAQLAFGLASCGRNEQWPLAISNGFS